MITDDLVVIVLILLGRRVSRPTVGRVNVDQSAKWERQQAPGCWTNSRCLRLLCLTNHPSRKLKITDLNARSATPIPTTAASQPNYCVSSQVIRAQMLEQSLLCSVLQKTEAKMEGVSHPQGSLSPLAWER